MTKTNSFDIVSEYDAGEMNNVFDQAKRELLNRYDFKGTSAAVEWLDAEKSGLKITGDNQYQLDAIIEMVRLKAATRKIAQTTFDTSSEPEPGSMKFIWTVPFISGLDKERAKTITKLLRDKMPKIKAQVQGEAVRVMSPKRDELQTAMKLLQSKELPFPITFNNYR